MDGRRRALGLYGQNGPQFVWNKIDRVNLARLSRKVPRGVAWGVILAVVLLALTIAEGASAKFIYFDF